MGLPDLDLSLFEAQNGEKEDPILQPFYSNGPPSARLATTTGGQQDPPTTAAPVEQGAEIGHRNKRARRSNMEPDRNAGRHSSFFKANMAGIEKAFREKPDISWTDLAERLHPGVKAAEPNEHQRVVSALKRSNTVRQCRGRVQAGGSAATQHDTAASSSAPARMPQQLAGVDPVQEVLVRARQLSTDQQWRLVHALLDQLQHAQQ